MDNNSNNNSSTDEDNDEKEDLFIDSINKSPIILHNKKKRRLSRGKKSILIDSEENLNNVNIITEDSMDERLNNDIYDPDEIMAHLEPEEMEEEGEDLLENPELDYQRMETLDQYDVQQLDDRYYSTMDYETRLEVENEMNRRDAREGRIQSVFQSDDDMEIDDTHRQQYLRRDLNQKQPANEIQEEEIMSLEQFDVPIREWITAERPRKELMRRFVL